MIQVSFRSIHRSKRRWLLGSVLACLLAFGATLGTPNISWAQFSDEETITGKAGASPTARDDTKPPVTFEIPDPIPTPPGFEKLIGFESDGQTPMEFAIDPASLVLGERKAQVTIAARSATGVLNLGYYGFDCEDLRYQLLAFGATAGGWQPVSRLRWREVRDGETRNRQFRAVYGAVCRLGGHAAQSLDDVVERLADPSRRLYINP